jgi:hypothetical protein
MSFPEIGRLMGNKNHSTVILACAKINRILDEDGTVRWIKPSGDKEAELRPIIEELEEQLGLTGQEAVRPLRSSAQRGAATAKKQEPPVTPAGGSHSFTPATGSPPGQRLL